MPPGPHVFLSPCSLPQTVAAAWELHTCLQLLQELPEDPGGRSAAAAPTDSGGVLAGDSPLPHSMASMSAVVSQRQHLHSLQRTFVDKAAAFLQQELGRVADGAPQRPGAADAAGLHRPAPADHSSLRRRAGQLAPLLEVVGVLRPAAVVAPREAYCQAVNALLKQEVRAAVAEVWRQAAAADAGGTVEPDLLARPSAAEAARWVVRTCGCGWWLGSCWCTLLARATRKKERQWADQPVPALLAPTPSLPHPAPPPIHPHPNPPPAPPTGTAGAASLRG